MSSSDEKYMRYALELAAQGQGHVEPNPMVGCVLVRENQIIGHGFHQRFGGPHAEVNALDSIGSLVDSDARSTEAMKLVGPVDSSANDAVGATAYVTLEPCSHFGKTGPCCDTLIKAKVARVVVACRDPNPLVAGQGLKRLEEAGIEVELGVLESQARSVMAPYLKRVEQSKPWIVAKWAMTMDGSIATSTGDSKWISSSQSRQLVHQLRDRVDAVMVGIGTALADDPMLNARLNVQTTSENQAEALPSGTFLAARSPALRVVVDSMARVELDSKLVTTAKEIPTMIAVGPDADPLKLEKLVSLGCTLFSHPSRDHNERLEALLTRLAEQQITNVLVEGGGKLLGSLHDLNQIDEVHCFLGPKIVGGTGASPVQGSGLDLIKDSTQLSIQAVQQVQDDVYIVARRAR